MKNTVFITGTGTHVGKTFVSCLLLQAFNAAQVKTFALKPIASGAHRDKNGKLRNQDALQLSGSANIHRPYQVVNPILFEKPIAPHIAANEVKVRLSTDLLRHSILSSIQKEADVNLIEGVGGWAVPLNHTELFSDVIIELRIPVILVVGIKLGCLNHAILTYQNIRERGCLIGWVANCMERNTLSERENIETLKQWIKIPCLGVVPFDCQINGSIDIQPIKNCLF